MQGWILPSLDRQMEEPTNGRMNERTDCSLNSRHILLWAKTKYHLTNLNWKYTPSITKGKNIHSTEMDLPLLSRIQML